LQAVGDSSFVVCIALAFDFRQDFIGDCAAGEELGQRGIEALQELGDGFIGTSDQ
jgi:hypothetical protein